jgi:hypothetical protein
VRLAVTLACMRKLIVSNFLALDGYCESAAPDAAVDDDRRQPTRPASATVGAFSLANPTEQWHGVGPLTLRIGR